MEDRNIKYTGREFSDFREQLIELAKNYFPNTYSDFSEDSPGMMFIEMASYVGDVLSFYQDIQLQETFLQYARNPSNLYALAYMMGYTPKISSPSRVLLEVSQEVDAVFDGENYSPNLSQALTLAPGMKVTSLRGGTTTFTTEDSVDFKVSTFSSPTTVDILDFDGEVPLKYLLTKAVPAISGETKTIQRTFGAAEKYTTLEIEDENIIGIESITDSEGNEWKEVPFLGQETIFEDLPNTGDDLSQVPYLLNLKQEPRRFVSRFISPRMLQIQFGSGVTGKENSTFLPNPNSLLTQNTLTTAYDPSNFLFTDTYGLAPSYTTLTIKYRTGRGVLDNVPSNILTEITEKRVTGTDLSKENTLSVNNPSPGWGGKDQDMVEEIRENSLRAFAEQKRTVTLQDYSIRALSLPTRYGSISKAYVKKGNFDVNIPLLESNPFAIQMYVLGYNGDGTLTTTSESLKNNLKKYLSQYIPLSDAVNILDAYIVNIGISYEIIPTVGQNSNEVLLKCNQALQKYFQTTNLQINTPIDLSQVFKLLTTVRGVQTVTNIQVENKTGGNYSPYGYDIKAATRNNIIYPSYDPCIFEVKYPAQDIVGRTITL